jgi:hypothetical protein
VGAWAARRPVWSDPAGRVGLAWGVQFLCSLLQLYGVLSRQLVYTRVGLTLASVLLPVMLAPPLLRWIGPAAQRWQWAILGVTVGAALVVLGAFGQGREYTLFYTTPLYFGLLVLSVSFLIAQARRAGDPQADTAVPGWLWIGGGHLVYFVTFVVGRPLIEVLVSLGWSEAVGAHMGTMLVYSGAMAAVAWGIWLGRVGARSARHASVLPTPG